MASLVSEDSAQYSDASDAPFISGLRLAEILSSGCLLAADVLAMAVAGAAVLIAFAWCGNQVSVAEAWTLAAMSGCLLGYLALRGRYTGRLPFSIELRIILLASWGAALAVAAWSLATQQGAVFAVVVASLLLCPAIATVTAAFAKSRLARSSMWVHPVLLIGDEATLDGVEGAIRSAPSLGYHVARRIDPALVAAAPSGARLRPLMERFGAQRAIVALPTGHTLRHVVMEAATTERVRFVVLPDRALVPDAASFLSRRAVLLSLCSNATRSPGRIFKIAFDVAVASLMLVLAVPLFALVAVANTLDGGPVFFVHRRVGFGARPFRCLKFRTMVVDGDSVLAAALARDPALAREWQETRKLRQDPRITRIGRILRRTSLDELPQLINVLRLEMSLVGPRPIVADETGRFGDSIVHYYATRPGLTGLWQVSGRSNTSFSRRVKLDEWYVRNWSVGTDMAVLLRTIPTVLARDGAY